MRNSVANAPATLAVVRIPDMEGKAMKVQVSFSVHAEMSEEEFGVMLSALAHYSGCDHVQTWGSTLEKEQQTASAMNESFVMATRNSR